MPYHYADTEPCDRFHGWAAARGDLTDEGNRREYDDVYKRLVTFFAKTL
jgi:hypothetical protein